MPDDVARAVVATAHASWYERKNTQSIELLAYSLPWLAQAPIEELYLPRSIINFMQPAHSLDEVASWLKPMGSRMGLARPTQVTRCEAKVARNDTCPCGSGKKVKRCCSQLSAPPIHSKAYATERAACA
jgi:hypothetical protein